MLKVFLMKMEKDINNLKIINKDIKKNISFKLNQISRNLLEVLTNNITRENLYINLIKRDLNSDQTIKRKLISLIKRALHCRLYTLCKKSN